MNAWTDFIMYPFGGFIVVLIGSLFLFAEVLVKGRLIFGLVGIASISLYFNAHISEGTAAWVALVFIAGIMLVFVDGKFVGDGTLGAIGLILMIGSLAVPSPSVLYGFSVIGAFLIGVAGSFYFLKFFPRRPLWSKLALRESLTSEKGYNSLSQEYKELLGREGIATTDFRPSGSIEVDGRLYSAISDGKWIEKGTKVIVTDVNGTRIMVDEMEEEDIY